MSTYIVTTHAILSVMAWIVVALGAGWAVFSKQIRDTTLERIGLSCVAITAAGTACRVIKNGWISEGGLLLSMSLAFYVCAIVWKHWMASHPAKPPLSEPSQ